jgi:hypothetical protein
MRLDPVTSSCDFKVNGVKVVIDYIGTKEAFESRVSVTDNNDKGMGHFLV